MDAPPQLVYRFIRQTIQPGPSVSLKCIASGNPTPNIKWTLDGFPLPQNESWTVVTLSKESWRFYFYTLSRIRTTARVSAKLTAIKADVFKGEDVCQDPLDGSETLSLQVVEATPLQ
ncbi:hypothetical protein J437_LFUL006813 [Ladona fulva]|uniref:Ig-like domain-containing protein n=1 Tax=Ladona fulva TaxID=123851 RepID=A0A8K0K4T4_LADFU|nr:hypothetical protein J437_LFUL006813 [Ladona fulva]